jgi:arylsulfatase A-like enzyme
VSSYPAQLIDIAPTVLALLGAPWNQMDGTALADALLSPPAGAAAAQNDRAPALSAAVQSMAAEASMERTRSLAR